MMFSKEQLTQLLRPLVVKWFTRGAIWLLTAKLGYDALAAETEGAQIASGLGTVVCVVAGILIDRWHHKTDKAEVPK